MSTDPDVIIIGSGLIGATFARVIREERPDARILVVESGPALSGVAGANVKDEIDLERRLEMQTMSQGPERRAGVQSSLDDRIGVLRPPTREIVARPGTSLLSAAGWNTQSMPASAQSTNVGGMGAHWTCACPWPNEDELPGAWDRERKDVARIFRVVHDAVEDAPVIDHVRSGLSALFPEGSGEGRGVQNMPMAVDIDTSGRSWTGTSTIYGSLLAEGPETFHILSDTLCTRVLVEDGRAYGVEVRAADGTVSEIHANAVVAAGDSLRTPQLLWASGIRPAALGVGLNEHMVVFSTVRLGVDGAGAASLPGGETDPVIGSLWIPYLGQERPFHGQITLLDLERAGVAGEDRFLAGLSWYVPTEHRDEHRVVFTDDETDYLGMPKGTIRFSRTPVDLQAAERAAAAQRKVADVLGPLREAEGPSIAVPGRSLHYTGTVRMGEDAEASVCDGESRVWGIENLYVGGNGVIPTRMAANTTAASAMIACRGARALAASLPEA